MMTQERLLKEKQALALIRQMEALKRRDQTPDVVKELRKLDRQLASLDVM